MNLRILREKITSAAALAEHDCKDVIPHNEHSYPVAFNKAMSRQLTDAEVPIWLINMLLTDPRSCEWSEAFEKNIAEVYPVFR